jgi:hypothetical protein
MSGDHPQQLAVLSRSHCRILGSCVWGKGAASVPYAVLIRLTGVAGPSARGCGGTVWRPVPTPRLFVSQARPRGGPGGVPPYPQCPLPLPHRGRGRGLGVGEGGRPKESGFAQTPPSRGLHIPTIRHRALNRKTKNQPYEGWFLESRRDGDRSRSPLRLDHRHRPNHPIRLRLAVNCAVVLVIPDLVERIRERVADL